MTHSELKSYLQTVGKATVNITTVKQVRDGGSYEFVTDTGDNFFVDFKQQDKFVPNLLNTPNQVTTPYDDKDVIIDLYLSVKRFDFKLKKELITRLHNTYPYLAQINSMGV